MLTRSVEENTKSLDVKKLTLAQRRSALEHFRDALKVGIPDDMRIVHVHSPEAFGPRSDYRVTPLSDGAIERLSEDENLYYCVAALKQHIYTDTGKGGWRRTQECIGAGVLVGFDDIGPKTVKKCGKGLDFFEKTLPPTAVIETSPGNFQMLYFFDTPILDVHRYGDILRSIIKPLSDRYGIDKLADINRVLRLPFGINNKTLEDGSLKYPDTDGNAWRVRLVYADYDVRYSPEAIAAAYGLEIVPTPRKTEFEKRVASHDEDSFKAAGFDLIVKALSGDPMTKALRTESGQKYRIRCPFEDEHASGGKNDDAFIADPAASKHGYFTFGCSHASCNRDSVAYAEGRRTFAAAMTAAGVANDARIIAERMEREELKKIEQELNLANAAFLHEVTGAESLRIAEADTTQTWPKTSSMRTVSATVEDEGAELEAKLTQHVSCSTEPDTNAVEIRKDSDIVKRAERLALENRISFKDVKQVRKGDAFIRQPLMTDENKLVVLNALFDGQDDRPHRDHYRGRIVDHENRIIDDHYPVTHLVAAFSSAGLKGVSLRAAREVIKEYALDHERNDLIYGLEKKIPEWDRKPRMNKKLIELFELRDTPLIQNVGQYFWLSLFNRMMNPGSLAPIAIALIGAQGCGKSLFAKKLCQILTDDEESDSVQLNLDGDWMAFLRAITGNSVIATVGEMAGFTRADTNKIKDITTRTADQMHYKFEGTFTQQRQWIMMLDGNKYELQRDETGNRRFMPLFCGQLEDVGGQPRWRQDFEAIFDDSERGIRFEDDVWQIMAECAEWMDSNGESGYAAFVREVVRQVKDFNAAEVDAERGIVVDGDIETYLDSALRKVKLEVIPMRDGGGKCCVRVDRIELIGVIDGLSRGKAKIHPSGMRKAMAARGAEEVKPSGVPKYRFANLADQDAFDAMLAARNPSPDEEVAKVEKERF